MANWKRAILCHDIIPWEIDLDHDPSTAPHRPFARFIHALANVDAVICSTRHTEHQLHAAWQFLGIPPGKTRAIHLPLDPLPTPAPTPAPTSPPTPLPPTNPPQILYVSSIAPRKNHDGLLQAAEILWRQNLRFELILVGRVGKTMEPLARHIETTATQRPIRWLRHIPDAALETAYQSAAFTVFPSLQEGFGLPIQESLLRRRPVICADFGAMNEVAGPHGTQRINVRSPETLANAIRHWLEDHAALASATQATHQCRFPTWTDYIHQIRDWLANAPEAPTSRVLDI